MRVLARKGNLTLVKSAAGAAYLMTNIQGSPRSTAQHSDNGGQGLPCTLVLEEAALAADLITQLIFKNLEQSLALHR